jgi:hypothetical protein
MRAVLSAPGNLPHPRTQQLSHEMHRLFDKHAYRVPMQFVSKHKMFQKELYNFGN